MAEEYEGHSRSSVFAADHEDGQECPSYMSLNAGNIQLLVRRDLAEFMLEGFSCRGQLQEFSAAFFH